MPEKKGILYGLGVGPGDPELLTLKAARILNSVDVVFAASSTKNSYSLAAIKLDRGFLLSSLRPNLIKAK